MQVRSYQDIGHDFLVPEAFSATMLPEWRLASFSLVLPIPESASVAEHGAPFDFGRRGWEYGRDKGLRTIENPMWDPARGVWRKPDEREGYYGDVIVEGGRPYYNDARNRFLEPVHDAVGPPPLTRTYCSPATPARTPTGKCFSIRNSRAWWRRTGRAAPRRPPSR